MSNGTTTPSSGKAWCGAERKSKPNIRILVRNSNSTNEGHVLQQEEGDAAEDRKIPAVNSSAANRSQSRSRNQTGKTANAQQQQSADKTSHPHRKGHGQQHADNDRNGNTRLSAERGVSTAQGAKNVSAARRKPKLQSIQLKDLAPQLSAASLQQKPKSNQQKFGNRPEQQQSPTIHKNPHVVSAAARQGAWPTDHATQSTKQPKQTRNQNARKAESTPKDGAAGLDLERDFPSLKRNNNTTATGLNPFATPWATKEDENSLDMKPKSQDAVPTTSSNAKQTPASTESSVVGPPAAKQEKGKKAMSTSEVNGKEAHGVAVKTQPATTAVAQSKKTQTPGKAAPKATSSPNNKKKSSSSTTKSGGGAKTTGGVSIAEMFAAKQRSSDAADTNMGGDELQLVRLMMQGKVASAKKGLGHRQRVRPRKKKFSTLKKHVLKERLLQWQRANPDVKNQGETPSGGEEKGGTASQDDAFPAQQQSTRGTTICILGFAEPDLLDDYDEYQELVSNLQDMSNDLAPYKSIFIPREALICPDDHGEDSDPVAHPAFVQFENTRGAEAAASCWNGITMGGQKLKIEFVTGIAANPQEDDSNGISAWESHCSDWFRGRVNAEPENLTTSQVVLENVLTEDDLEDEDCLEESLNDIRKMAEAYGAVKDVQPNTTLKSVTVVFQASTDAARQAAEHLARTVIGGSTIVARLQQSDERCSILLRNVFSDEDLNDEECLAESMDDLKELAGKYGQVMSVERIEDTSSARIVFFGKDEVATSAAAGFRGMVVGGNEIEAIVENGTDENFPGSKSSSSLDGGKRNEVGMGKSVNVQTSTSNQLFSGDKIIGEKWAECKRAPKIPLGSNPRPYATLVDDETAKPLLVELLSELMRLQKRAVEEDKNTKTKRRLVLGLREVARGIRTRKVKMVVMANNLDEYGAIDEKIQEILDLAYQESVPVFFEFSKRGLGKAIGKTIKVAVVGIQNPEGAYQPFKKLLKLQPSFNPPQS